jgi:hypothetical protein
MTTFHLGDAQTTICSNISSYPSNGPVRWFMCEGDSWRVF